MNRIIYLFCLVFFNQFLFAQESVSPSETVYFEENQGQFVDMNGKLVPDVLFKLQGAGINLYVTKTGLTYVFQQMEPSEDNDLSLNDQGLEPRSRTINWERVDVRLPEANINSDNYLVRNENNQGTLNYFLAHCPDGLQGIKKYGKVIFEDIYPNIDWVLYTTNKNGFKYDFVLHAGANPNDIQLVYNMRNKLSMKDGKLEISIDYGTMTESAPVSFMNEELVPSKFMLESAIPNDDGGYSNIISFSLDAETTADIQNPDLYHELVIDPELQWGTFFGGSGVDTPTAVASDSENNLYVAVSNYLANFPVQSTTGYYQGNTNGLTEIALLKFNEAGALLWSTYYGGTFYEEVYGITVDQDDNIYFAGTTGSFDFPTQDAGTYYDVYSNGGEDGFILKFNGQGDRLWATYVGGADNDEILSIDVRDGMLYVVGSTKSTDFPLALVGGSANAYYQNTLQGYADATLQKFDEFGNLLWSTYYGGNGFDRADASVLDGEGNLYVTGFTTSGNFDTQNAGGYYQGNDAGLGDAFILKFDEFGNRLWSTHYGGSSKDIGNDLAVDNDNNLFFYGYTESTDLPLMDNGTYFMGTHVNTTSAPFVSNIPFLAKFNQQGDLTWATYHGSQYAYSDRDQHNIAVDECGYVYCSTVDVNGIEEIVPFADGGYMSEWTGSSHRLSWFTNDGVLLGASPICIASGLGDAFVCTGKDGVVWTVSETNYLNTAIPFDHSVLPLMPGESGAYYDNSADTISDDLFIAKFKTDFENCKIVGAEPFGDLVIPNVFTPNNDQSNDLYSLNIDEAAYVEFTISNRWGNVVYQASGSSPTWDGKDLSGDPVVDGVYYISYFIEKENGTVTAGQGFIHLERD
ncbi:MAG: SBBP repeat-containing protein [Crocinitomicaceae bacterium]